MLRMLLTGFLLTSLMAPLWVQAQEAAAPTTTPLIKPEKLDLQDGDSIVFLGDSITHQCLYTQYVEDYFYTRFPQIRLKLHNAGVGGARAWDALQRFDKDVAAYRPKYVSILLGMNDGTYKPYDEEMFQTYRQDMTTLLNQLVEIGAQPIPMTPTMYDSRAKRLFGKRDRSEDAITLYNSVLAYYGTWLREMAGDRGYHFVDMWSPLNNLTLESREKDPRFTLIKDAIHPGAPGQVVMATAMIEDLELPRQVSSIHVHHSAKKNWVGTVQNGELRDLQTTDKGISFRFTAKALPWVLPSDAQLGVDLTHLGHRYSRETFRVNGLAEGKYTLKINDTAVGTYSADQLAKGIELEANSKTPQHQQALNVASLNKTRNEGPIRALRGEWFKFQTFARAKRDLEKNPEDQSAKEKLAASEKAIAGMDERIVQHTAEAKAIEDEIFKINQPQSALYVLEQVE